MIANSSNCLINSGWLALIAEGDSIITLLYNITQTALCDILMGVKVKMQTDLGIPVCMIQLTSTSPSRGLGRGAPMVACSYCSNPWISTPGIMAQAVWNIKFYLTPLHMISSRYRSPDLLIWVWCPNALVHALMQGRQERLLMVNSADCFCY